LVATSEKTHYICIVKGINRCLLWELYQTHIQLGDL